MTYFWMIEAHNSQAHSKSTAIRSIKTIQLQVKQGINFQSRNQKFHKQLSLLNFLNTYFKVKCTFIRASHAAI